ncbi:mucin-2-like [Heptranchias perlo]|uniref:mucin-2-like n=1 Tax=Heptranchias perlo TaxID=212740 RepID=UPI00355A86DE
MSNHYSTHHYAQQTRIYDNSNNNSQLNNNNNLFLQNQWTNTVTWRQKPNQKINSSIKIADVRMSYESMKQLSANINHNFQARRHIPWGPKCLNWQAIVHSAGKSGFCNFTLCTESCQIFNYTGKCQTTTAPTTTPSTPESTTTVTITPSSTATTTCSCKTNGQILSPGQAIVSSAGKSGFCNFTLCTESCQIFNYTGKCQTTTAPTTTPSTPESTTTVTITPSSTATTTCSCKTNGQILSPGQAIVHSAGKSGFCNFTLCTESCQIFNYTGKCQTTTAPTTTPSTPESTTTVTITPSSTATTTCSCKTNGQILSPGQAIVHSAGKSGFCNFTLCTESCQIFNYTGKCQTTTAPTTTPSTPESTTTVTITPSSTATTTCSCKTNGQILSPGQAIVSSAGKSGFCNFTLCTESCQIFNYTGKCQTTTAPTTTPSTPESTTTVTITPSSTATTTCSCKTNGQILSPGQAIVHSAGKSGFCNFTLCTESCQIFNYTGKCQTTTAPTTTPSTPESTTTVTITPSSTATTTCSCKTNGQILSPGQAIVSSAGKSGFCNFTLCTESCQIFNYTGKCQTTTAPTTTPSTPESTTTVTITPSSTATTTCSCKTNGQILSPGQAIVHSAGKSGFCNFTLCTESCQIFNYTGKCQTTTAPTTTPSTPESTTTVTITPSSTATTTCSCKTNGQILSPGQAIVSSAGKSGFCNFTLCTESCQIFNYTGKCQTTTAPTTTPSTPESTTTVTITPSSTATTTCSCKTNGQILSPGQAIVHSAGKSGFCNFTLCTESCQIFNYTGKCQTTTAPTTTPSTPESTTTVTITPSSTATTTCSCKTNGQILSPGQAIVSSAGKSGFCNFTLCTESCQIFNYTGKCQTTTAPTTTPSTPESTTTVTITPSSTATTTCSCKTNGQILSPGQAIVHSAGKSGFCNFTLCTESCQIFNYTGKCQTTTAPTTTPSTPESTTTVTITPSSTATTTCSCKTNGQILSPGQAIVSSAGKSGFCNFTLCTESCQIFNYTGKCQTTTAPTTTPSTPESTTTVTITPSSTATTTCSCKTNGQILSPGQAIVHSAGKSGFCNFTLCTESCQIFNYTGKCQTTTAPTTTPSTPESTTTVTITPSSTATTTCSCKTNGQILSPGQAIVSSAGKSGFCNFTLCTESCQIFSYTGKCQTTTAPTTTPSTPESTTTVTITPSSTATTTCSCKTNGQILSPGQAIVHSAGKSGFCNFTLCTESCQIFNYTGKCQTTTAPTTTPSTPESTTTVTITPSSTATTTCSCKTNGQILSPGQAIVHSAGKSGFCNFTLCTESCQIFNYTGKCQTTTAPTTTPSTPESTTTVTITPSSTATTTCSCKTNGQILSPGQAIVHSAGKSGFCNFTLCTESCQIFNYTGKCQTTTAPTTTPSTPESTTTVTITPSSTATTTCSCKTNGQILSPGQAIVSSAGKSGFCNFTLCTESCQIFNYTGKCQTTTAPTTTPSTPESTTTVTITPSSTATTTCSCKTNGQILSPGQAIVHSAGKSGFCNFTLCTESCQIFNYTGKCQTTTAPTTTPSTPESTTTVTITPSSTATTTCSCKTNGQILSPDKLCSLYKDDSSFSLAH